MKAAAESAEILVYDRDFPLRWGQARKNHQTERFPHAKTVPAALLDFDDADKQIGWIDQIESHDVLSTINMVLRFLLIFFNAGLMIGVSL